MHSRIDELIGNSFSSQRATQDADISVAVKAKAVQAGRHSHDISKRMVEGAKVNCVPAIEKRAINIE